MKPESQHDSHVEKYRALLSVAEAINTHRNLAALLHDISTVSHLRKQEILQASVLHS